jgi:hypothetical protein
MMLLFIPRTEFHKDFSITTLSGRSPVAHTHPRIVSVELKHSVQEFKQAVHIKHDKVAIEHRYFKNTSYVYVKKGGLRTFFNRRLRYTLYTALRIRQGPYLIIGTEPSIGLSRKNEKAKHGRPIIQQLSLDQYVAETIKSLGREKALVWFQEFLYYL